MSHLVCRTALAVGLSAAFATQARAQSGAPEPSQPVERSQGAKQTAFDDGDVVVTARLRNERLLDVPVAVTAIDETALERYRSDTLAKITEIVPTVQIVNYGNSAGGGTFSVRGVGTAPSQGGFEQAVLLVVDGIPLSTGRLASLGYFDLDRVEVLKGPQALFFGKNSTAGVISLVSASPQQAFEGQVRASYEFVGDEAVAEGVLSGGLANGLSGRIALRYRNLAGWLYNDARPIANPYNAGAPLPGAVDFRAGEREFLGRATLRYVGGNFDATLKLAGQTLKDDGLTNQNIGPCPTGRPQLFQSNILATDPFGECRPDNHYSTGSGAPAVVNGFRGYRPNNEQYSYNKAAIISLSANWQLTPELTLSSISGNIRYNQKSLYGFDQTVYSQTYIFNTDRSNNYSQEVRLGSSFSGPINFFVGGFYQDNFTSQFIDLKLSDVTNLALPAPAQCFNPAIPRFTCYNKVADLRGTTLSFFGQVSFKPLARLELSGGVRYTRERKAIDEVGLYGRGPFNVSNTIYAESEDKTPGTLVARYRDSNWSPEATISYHPVTDSTIYLSYKTGYKSGGFGISQPLTTTLRLADIDFDSESASGFEAGAKGRIGRLRVEASAFAYDYTDLQVTAFDPTTLAFRISNAGKLRQRGADLQVAYRVSPALNLRGSVAYTRNRLSDFVGQCYSFRYPAGTTRAQLGGAAPGVAPTPAPGCQFASATSIALAQNFEGRTPARSPDWAGNAGATITQPLGQYTLTYNADAIFSSGYFPGETMAPGTYQDGFAKFNAGVTLASQKGWELSFIGRNLTNRYIVGFANDRTGGLGSILVPGENRGTVARGRELTLQALYRF